MSMGSSCIPQIPLRLFCALDTVKCRQRTFLLCTESFEGFASARLAPFIEASPTFYSLLDYIRRHFIFLDRNINEIASYLPRTSK